MASPKMTRFRLTVLQVAAMSGAAAVLFAMSRFLLTVPCWVVVVFVAATAWPIWAGRREYALFQHRLVIEAVAHEDSHVRRWFWRGGLTSAWQTLVALFWAALLLAISPLLDPWHAGLLAADILVLAIGARYAASLLAIEVRAERAGMLSRRWVLPALNIAFLAASGFVIDYFIAGSPDTRGLAWDAVAERAYDKMYVGATCPLAGAIVGALNVVDHLNWHAAQLLIPSLGDSRLNLLAWALFLAQAGVVAFAYTRLQIGVLAIVERRATVATGPRDSLMPTLLPVLAVSGLLAAYMVRDVDVSAFRAGLGAVVAKVNPCRSEARAVPVLKTALSTEIDNARMAEHKRAEKQIDEALDKMFVDVEKGVDRYLDWYFSLIGEYSRLLKWAAAKSVGNVAEGMNAELERMLFSDQGVGTKLAEIDKQIAAGTGMRMSELAGQIGNRLENDVSLKPCWADWLHLPAIPDIKRDALRVSVAGVGGVGGAVAASVMAGRFSKAAAVRLASKPAFRSAAGIVTRTAGKRAGSILVAAGTGAALCAPTGPFALLCGLAAGAATWFTIDKALITIDEILFREEMRKEILDAVQLQKAELALELRKAHGAFIDSIAFNIHKSVDGVFIPARDGRSAGASFEVGRKKNEVQQ